MVTYKVVLDERRANNRGTYPVMFRITSNRMTSNYSTGIALLKEHWDQEASLVRNLCPNYRELNKNLSSKFLKAQRLILQLEEDGEFTFETFKQRMSTKPVVKQQKTLFVAYANQLVADMIEVKRVGNALVYQTAINRVSSFSNNMALNFHDIDYAFIERFKHHLAKDGVKPNTVGNYLRSIRAIYNKAIKAKLADRTCYPFHEITIKTEKTAKRAISNGEISSIYKSAYKPYSPKWHARNYFLLSFSLRGISFTDLAYLTTSNIKDGIVTYKRKKTGAQLSVRLNQLATDIFQLYRGTNQWYLLPVFTHDISEDGIKAKASSRQWIKTTNKWLKRIASDCDIQADVTTYVTRHSWATIAKKLGYSNELIAECLGHQYGNKITNIYLDNFDQHLIDDGNEKVLYSIQV
jgi:integrase/recombinase XerD